MDDMRELIDLPTANAIVRGLAIGLPAAGLVIGAVVGAVRRRLGRDALAGLVIGLSGVLLWAMWLAFNGITNHYGLDSVKGLLINLAIFVAVGVAVGLVVGLVLRRTQSHKGGLQ
jgi:NhaP-type Na+/H+ or K+/H+ antiporter